jgi:hypothetical protein
MQRKVMNKLLLCGLAIGFVINLSFYTSPSNSHSRLRAQFRRPTSTAGQTPSSRSSQHCRAVFRVPPNAETGPDSNTALGWPYTDQQLDDALYTKSARKPEERHKVCCLPQNRRDIEALVQSGADLRALGAQGYFRVEGGDFYAGASTLFILQPLNAISIAEQHCLVPWTDFTERGTLSYKGGQWTWFFKPIPNQGESMLDKSFPVFTLNSKINNLGVHEYLLLHQNTPWAIHPYHIHGGIDDVRHTDMSLYPSALYERWREEGSRLVNSYVDVNNNTRLKVDDFWNKNVRPRLKAGGRVLGIHIRGADAVDKRLIVPPVDYLPYVRQFSRHFPGSVVYVATDTIAFAEEVQKWQADGIVDHVVVRDIKRVDTGTSLLA